VVRVVPIVAVIVVIPLIFASFTYWTTNRVRGHRQDRRALLRHEQFVRDLRELAWQHRDVDPFAIIIDDEITKFNRDGREITS